MTKQFDLPECGLTFWPVGNGDSITITLPGRKTIQVDVNHRQRSEEDDDPRVPVIDRLVEVLPLNDDDEPEICMLVITHHDEDHCSGFGTLLEQVKVSELWVTMRSFIEDRNDEGLTDAGQAVYDEACRRRDKEIEAAARGERAHAGDRLRVVGRSDLFDDPEWCDFPEDLRVGLGGTVKTINAEDWSDVLEVFVHTPFQDDCESASRNSSSLGLHLTLKDADGSMRVLLLGDLEYEQIEAFVEKTKEKGRDEYLEWDVLLAPHHGSRNAIMRIEDGEWVKAESATYLADGAASRARVVVSSRAFDEISDSDTNPPHQDAKQIYEDMVGADNLLMVADYAQGTDSTPLVVSIEGDQVTDSVTKKRWADKLASIGVVGTVAAPRPGDKTSGPGDREFA